MLLNPRGLSFAILLQFSGLISAQSVTDVFNVKTSGGGACDVGIVQQWFADSVTLINDAATGVAATDTDSRKYLTTFFKIGPNDDTSAVSSKIKAVQDFVNGGQLPGGQPRLYCGSDWVTKAGWDDIALNQTTGQPRADGLTIAQIWKPSRSQRTKLAPYWSPDLMQYVFDDPVDLCSDTETLGGTQDNTKPATVTLCINNFKDPLYLSSISVDKEGQSVSTLQVQSLTLFHELFHLCVGCKLTPDNGYTLQEVVGLSAGKAAPNPESYTFYALAYHLGQNTDYTFANTKSKAKSTTPEGSPPPPRRSVDEWLKMYKPPPPPKKPSPWKVWVA